MVRKHAKGESLVSFVEKAKSENQKGLNEVLEFERMLEDITRESEHPQIYQIKVKSNW